jgi:hypothetical protein
MRMMLVVTLDEEKVNPSAEKASIMKGCILLLPGKPNLI